MSMQQCYSRLFFPLNFFSVFHWLNYTSLLLVWSKPAEVAEKLCIYFKKDQTDSLLLVISLQNCLPCIIPSLLQSCQFLQLKATKSLPALSIYTSVKVALHHPTDSKIRLGTQDSTETFPAPPSLSSCLRHYFRQNTVLKEMYSVLGFPMLLSILILILNFANHSFFKTC